jgi:hypothetical protein
VEIAEGGRLKEKLERKTGKRSCGMHASEPFDVRDFFLEWNKILMHYYISSATFLTQLLIFRHRISYTSAYRRIIDIPVTPLASTSTPSGFYSPRRHATTSTSLVEAKNKPERWCHRAWWGFFSMILSITQQHFRVHSNPSSWYQGFLCSRSRYTEVEWAYPCWPRA